MNLIVASLQAALRLFFHRRILWVVIGLPLLSLLFWGVAMFFLWTPLTHGLTSLFSGGAMERLMSDWFGWSAGDVSGISAAILIFVLFLPVSYVTTLILTSLFVAPYVQFFLLKSQFPTLQRRPGGSLVGSVRNTVRFGGLYLLLFFLTLPLWLIPGGAVLVPITLTAWLNRRVLTYDLLQDVATDDERLYLNEKYGHALFLLCFIMGLLALVPGLAFFLPVLSTLALGWFCNSALQRLRAQT